MIKAFIYGVIEFRLSVTSNFPTHETAYEYGREFAHRVTFRYYDND